MADLVDSMFADVFEDMSVLPHIVSRLHHPETAAQPGHVNVTSLHAAALGFVLLRKGEDASWVRINGPSDSSLPGKIDEVLEDFRKALADMQPYEAAAAAISKIAQGVEDPDPCGPDSVRLGGYLFSLAVLTCQVDPKLLGISSVDDDTGAVAGSVALRLRLLAAAGSLAAACAGDSANPLARLEFPKGLDSSIVTGAERAVRLFTGHADLLKNMLGGAEGVLLNSVIRVALHDAARGGRLLRVLTCRPLISACLLRDSHRATTAGSFHRA
jgi:hypothetical protein